MIKRFESSALLASMEDPRGLVSTFHTTSTAN